MIQLTMAHCLSLMNHK